MMMLLFQVRWPMHAPSMVHLVCLFMKSHLLALLQDNCLDLVRCAFLGKLSPCVRNITVFYQHLLRPIESAILANINISVKPKYRPDISARPIYQSVSGWVSSKFSVMLSSTLVSACKCSGADFLMQGDPSK